MKSYEIDRVWVGCGYVGVILRILILCLSYGELTDGCDTHVGFRTGTAVSGDSVRSGEV